MMKMTAKLQILCVLVAFIAASLSSAIPPPTDEHHKSRVIDRPLSDEDHFDDDDDDDPSDDHNEEYDHEAFLGKDEARSFDKLTPEESKEKLALIYVKIDKDSDGQVTEPELADWIKHVQNRYIRTDTDRQWIDLVPKDSDTTHITWDNYTIRTYGHTEDLVDEETAKLDEEVEYSRGYSYKTMMKRDKRRWSRADQNNDGMLDKQEFSDFLHPEDVPHMKDLVIDETLDDIDKDHDGFISLEEYIGDMWPNKEGDEEPDWVKTERDQFNTYRDKDKDGKMNREEVSNWILPPDYDHSLAEAKHLIYESDTNKDGSLTEEEVLIKYDLFVGSQATDFGEALIKHDEF